MNVGKKGSIIDTFVILIVFVIMGIVLIVSLFLKDAIFPKLSNALNNETGSTSVMATVSGGFTIFDNLFLLAFFMLNATTIIMAALVPSHPVFLIVNVMLLIILFVIAPTFSNIMQKFWSTPDFAAYSEGGGASQTLPIMTRMFQYLPSITLGISVLLIIVQYSKNQGGGG